MGRTNIGLLDDYFDLHSPFVLEDHGEHEMHEQLVVRRSRAFLNDLVVLGCLVQVVHSLGTKPSDVHV